MRSPFRVAICGGGLGGLTLALVIGKYDTLGLPVEIFEAGPTITTIGAGISLFARTMDIMKDMGLYDELVKMATRPPQENTSMNFRKSDQRDGYHWFSRELKRGFLSLHRKDLVEFLLRHIPHTCKIHTSKKLAHYDVDPKIGNITLHFTDGSSATMDVLVGADGIRSATRKTMYECLASFSQGDESRKRLLEYVDPVWTGILAYRSLFPTPKLLKEDGASKTSTLTMYLGRNKNIVTFPISQGQLLNVVVFIYNTEAFGTPYKGHWVTDVPENEVSDQFRGWEVSVDALVKRVEKPSRWALHSVRPLPHYVDGKVVLLGDAAHAMEPHFDAGAGQAMEDAFVLGRLLPHELTHQGNVSDTLKIYEQVRLPFANSIVQQSRDVGRSYSFSINHIPVNRSFPFRGTPEELDHVRMSIEDAWEWQSESAWVWSEAEERWRAKCSQRAKL